MLGMDNSLAKISSKGNFIIIGNPGSNSGKGSNFQDIGGVSIQEYKISKEDIRGKWIFSFN